MRIKDGFSVVNLQGQNTVVADSANSSELQNTIVLTDTSLFLWNQMKDREFDVEDAADALVSRYGIDRELAARDAQAWCDKLEECHLLAE